MGVPTLIWSIIYFIFVSIWEFKLCFYKLKSYYISWAQDSISELLLWSVDSYTYKSYFHCIWDLSSKKPIMVQIMQKINNKLNLN